MRSATWLREAAQWIAAAVAIAIEGVLVWAVDRLPMGAQILVYGIPVALFVVGFVSIVRTRAVRRRG